MRNTNRNEYPRPEMVRKNWINLNGEWDFAFDFANTLLEKHPLTEDKRENSYCICREFPEKIFLPFCPESELSGIGYKKFVRACWYRKKISLSKNAGKRWLLHFEAAYHTTHVYINDSLVVVHRGGYTPFTADITDFIDGETEIKVHCYGDPRDPGQPSGKQSPKENSYGCFYTRCTGIWQTVWLEEVPETYLEKIHLTPDVDNARVNAVLTVKGGGRKKIELEALFDGKTVGKSVCRIEGNISEARCQIALDELHLWNTETPALYDLKVSVFSDCGVDEVQSYFGMRKLEADSLGMKINGKRIFQRLVLDQGYYPKGIYTAENEEDLKGDILRAKAFGFNGARLHEKVFERRYLYWADKLGYLVWGEYPNWGFDHTSESGFLHFLPEWLEAVERDYNHPSIVGWCPMNENFDFYGKRQCDGLVKQIYCETKRFDPTRPCIDVSWNFHTETDIYDIHDYTQDLEEFEKRFARFEDGKVFDTFKQPYKGQPFFLSEYGGLKWPFDAEGWAYNDEDVTTEDAFAEKFNAFIKVLFSNPRICACCYTQLTDVEQEKNGLYYYDRTEKFTRETVKKMREVISGLSEYEKQK